MNFHEWYDSAKEPWRLIILLGWMSLLVIFANWTNPILGSIWGLLTIILIATRIRYLNHHTEK